MSSLSDAAIDALARMQSQLKSIHRGVPHYESIDNSISEVLANFQMKKMTEIADKESGNQEKSGAKSSNKLLPDLLQQSSPNDCTAQGAATRPKWDIRALMHKIKNERSRPAAQKAAVQSEANCALDTEDSENLVKLAPFASAFIGLIGGFCVGTLVHRRRAELEWRERQASQITLTLEQNGTIAHGSSDTSSLPLGTTNTTHNPIGLSQARSDAEAPRPASWALPAGLETLRVEDMTLAELEAALVREQARRRARLRAARGMRAAAASGRLQQLFIDLRAAANSTSPACPPTQGGSAVAAAASPCGPVRRRSVRWATSTRNISEAAAPQRDGSGRWDTAPSRLHRAPSFDRGQPPPLAGTPPSRLSPLAQAGGLRRVSMPMMAADGQPGLWAKARQAIKTGGGGGGGGGDEIGRSSQRRLSSPPEA